MKVEVKEEKEEDEGGAARRLYCCVRRLEGPRTLPPGEGAGAAILDYLSLPRPGRPAERHARDLGYC
ncbi:hypothetical protein O3P69_005755 [Scylla paramamosain]|uniref:Uncharacterized protein n=1 Tax=Scylla paramamosain TaxID=85552 RepID=A0AAW0U703_SCYPA